MASKYVSALTMAATVVVLDQATKLAALRWLSERPPVDVIPGFFRLVFTYNRGAAFGLLNRSDITWQRTFFIVFTLVALGIVAVIFRSVPREDRVQIWGLALVFGGALGNLIDRVRLGMVVDFLDFYVHQYHWPAFNIADSAITVGIGLIALSILRSPAHVSGSR